MYCTTCVYRRNTAQFRLHPKAGGGVDTNIHLINYNNICFTLGKCTVLLCVQCTCNKRFTVQDNPGSRVQTRLIFLVFSVYQLSEK